MIAAVYARKSTEQTGVADEQKSVARQVEHATAYARRKGWSVDETCVFVDDGISGAEFSKRPGFLRLMNALKPKPAFQVLVMSEESRLGREAIETAYALKQLVQAGVQVWSYLDDRQRTLDGPLEKAMLALQTMADEMEREKARLRTGDAMVRKAKAGHLCGGACYGYVNVAVTGPDGKRSHVDRAVDEAQAAVVRRVFTLAAEGWGVKRIAKAFNAEGVMSPRPQRGRPRAWAPSSVRAVLHRESYRGVYVYNATKKSDRWGQRKTTKRAADDVVRADAPHWRIVSDAEWAAAHRRLDTARQCYVRGTGGQLWGRPPAGLASKYLLSGLLRCASCGASLTVRSRAHGKRRFYYYTCASYDHRGETVCNNGLLLPMDRADDAIIAKVEQLLDPETVRGAIADAVARLRPSPEAAEARRTVLLRELEVVGAEQARVAEALATGGHVEALVTSLREREPRRLRLVAELAALDAAGQGTFDGPRVARELQRRATEWRALVRRHTPIARQALDRLLADKITWTPDAAHREYRYRGRLKFNRLLDGIVSAAFPQGVASPTGFEPVFWP